MHNPDVSIMVDKEGAVMVDSDVLGDRNRLYNEVVDDIRTAYGVEEGVLATMADM